MIEAAPATDPVLGACVSSRYVDAFVNGHVSDLAHSDPYRFAFLNDFFKPEFYERISTFKPALDKSYTSRTGYEIEIYYEPYFNEEFIRLVYGKAFRLFLARLMGASRVTRPIGKYPQLRSIRGDQGGMGIHDDNSAGYNGVAFFNTSDQWMEGAGGELVIWEGLGGERYRKRFEFAPRGNSVSVMRFSDGSYHSVNSPNGTWMRTNILVELQFED